MAHEDEIVVALRSLTQELEEKDINEDEIISVAFAYFCVMLSKHTDRQYAMAVAQRALGELDLVSSRTDGSVAKLTGMLSLMKKSPEGAEKGSIKRILGLFRKES